MSDVMASVFERKPRGCVSREDVLAPPQPTLGLDEEFDEHDPTMLSDDGEDYFATIDMPQAGSHEPGSGMVAPPSQGEALVSDVMASVFERKPRGCVSREDVLAPPQPTLGLDGSSLSPSQLSKPSVSSGPLSAPSTEESAEERATLDRRNRMLGKTAPGQAASAHPSKRPARSTRPHASALASVTPGTAPGQCQWVEVRLVATADRALVEFVFPEEVPEESAEEAQRRTDRRNRMLGKASAQPPAEAAPASATPRHRRGAGRTSPTKAERTSTSGRISPPKAGRASPTKAGRTSPTKAAAIAASTLPPRATLSPPPQTRKPLASSPLASSALTAESVHSPPTPLLPHSPPTPLLLAAPTRPRDHSPRPSVNSVMGSAMGRLSRGYSSVALRRGGLPEEASDAVPSPPSSLTSRLVESRSKLRLPLQLHDWEQRLWRPVLSSTGEQRQNRRLVRRDGRALAQLAVPVLAGEMQADAVRSSPRRASTLPAVSSHETEAARQREAQRAVWAQERDRLQRAEREQAQQRASELSQQALLHQRESAAQFWKARVRPGCAPPRTSNRTLPSPWLAGYHPAAVHRETPIVSPRLAVLAGRRPARATSRSCATSRPSCRTGRSRGTATMPTSTLSTPRRPSAVVPRGRVRVRGSPRPALARGGYSRTRARTPRPWQKLPKARRWLLSTVTTARARQCVEISARLSGDSARRPLCHVAMCVPWCRAGPVLE